MPRGDEENKFALRQDSIGIGETEALLSAPTNQEE
jgi:hypothetical protein